MEAQLIHSDMHGAFGRWQNVQLTVFTGQLQMAHLPVVTQLRNDLVKKYGNTVVGVVTVVPGCRLPEPDVRNACVEMLRELSVSDRGAAYVVEGFGAGATALRAVISAMLLATRSAQPQKVFSELHMGVSWVRDRSVAIGAPVDGQELLTAASHFRHRQVSTYAPKAAASA